MNSLQLTKTKIAAIVVGGVAVLGWIASIQVPFERMQFIYYALGRLWLEIVVLVALVYLSVVYKRVAGFGARLFAHAKQVNGETGGLVLTSFVASMVMAVAVCVLWFDRIEIQVAETAHRRAGMYESVFRDSYITYVRNRASRALSEGAPSKAAEQLGIVAAWPLAGGTEQRHYARYKQIAESREALAAEMFSLAQSLQSPITNVAGNAYFGGALVLNRQKSEYRDVARARMRALETVRATTAAIFAACGVGHTKVSARDDQACSYIAGQSLGLGANSCEKAATSFCDVFKLQNVSERLRKRKYLDVFDRTTGYAGLKKIVLSPVPEWTPSYTPRGLPDQADPNP